MNRLRCKGLKRFGIGLFMCMLLSGCQSETRLVQVASADGDVRVNRQEEATAFKAVKGMNLNAQDVLRTYQASSAVIHVDNDKRLEMSENVELHIIELFGKLKNVPLTSLELVNGKVLIKIQKALKPDERFELKTPTCIMGVRGTQYFVAVDQKQTDLMVLEGKVEVKLLSDLSKSLFVSANQKIHIDQTIVDIETIPILPLEQKDLDLMVLKSIQAEPEGIAPYLLDNLDQFIEEQLKPPTGGINPMKIVNRRNFEAIQMLDSLETLKAYLGEPVADSRFVSAGNTGYKWTEDVGMIAVSVNAQGLVVDKIETGLETGSSEVDLGNPELTAKITPGLTLEEIDAITGQPHYEFRRVLTPEGQLLISYGWYSTYNGGYSSITIQSVDGVLSNPSFYTRQ